jgi:hypothetical protein
MAVAALIIVTISALTAAVVFGVFIWAARKDGE